MRLRSKDEPDKPKAKARGETDVRDEWVSLGEDWFQHLFTHNGKLPADNEEKSILRQIRARHPRSNRH